MVGHGPSPYSQDHESLCPEEDRAAGQSGPGPWDSRILFPNSHCGDGVQTLSTPTHRRQPHLGKPLLHPLFGPMGGSVWGWGSRRHGCSG